MQSSIAILCLLSMLFTNNSWAETSQESENKNYCICLTGTEPEYQIGFFEKGCRKWLEEQPNCVDKRIEPINEEKSEIQLPSDKGFNRLALGYVGHWGNTNQSINYFNNVLIPTINRHKVNLSFDNTACRGLTQPDQFNSYFQAIIRYSKSLERLDSKRYPLPEWMKFNVEYKANQAISVGMWDRFVGGASMNFWAQVNLQQNQVTIPSCSNFRDQVCHFGLQKYDTPKCKDEQTGELVRLKCCLEKDSGTGLTTSTAFWGARTTCE